MQSSDKDKNRGFPKIIWSSWETDGTATQGTQPRDHMTTMGKVDTSDMIMITSVTYILSVI